jgi:HD superfamily phosphohydrolase
MGGAVKKLGLRTGIAFPNLRMIFILKSIIRCSFNMSHQSTFLKLFTIKFVLVAFLSFFPLGCSDSSNSTSTKATSESQAGGEVVWKTLSEIDHTSHELMAFMQAGDFDSIIVKAPVVNKQINDLSNEPIPANAKNKTELKNLQKALKDLAHEFDALLENDLSKEEQAKIIIAFSPVTHEMMRLAGMPHQHSKPELPALVGEAINGTLKPQWLSQLIDSQLDVDRFDYLLRDSYMTGVKDGIFDLERLLLMLRIHPQEGTLYIDRKGLLAVEKYIQSRYHMYRQVYFHKTVATAEAILLATLSRARHCWESPSFRRSTPYLLHPYLENPGSLTVEQYLAVDDVVLTSALQQWAASAEDPILQDLSQRLLNRSLFKCIEIQNFDSNDLENQLRIDRARLLIAQQGFDPQSYLLFSNSGDAPYQPYTNTVSKKQPILIQSETGDLEDVQHASPTIRAYTESPYTIWRVFYPTTHAADWREQMRRIFVD